MSDVNPYQPLNASSNEDSNHPSGNSRISDASAIHFCGCVSVDDVFRANALHHTLRVYAIVFVSIALGIGAFYCQIVQLTPFTAVRVIALVALSCLASGGVMALMALINLFATWVGYWRGVDLFMWHETWLGPGGIRQQTLTANVELDWGFFRANRCSRRVAILWLKASPQFFIISRALLDSDDDWHRVRRLLAEQSSPRIEPRFARARGGERTSGLPGRAAPPPDGRTSNSARSIVDNSLKSETNPQASSHLSLDERSPKSPADEDAGSTPTIHFSGRVSVGDVFRARLLRIGASRYAANFIVMAIGIALLSVRWMRFHPTGLAERACLVLASCAASFTILALFEFVVWIEMRIQSHRARRPFLPHETWINAEGLRQKTPHSKLDIPWNSFRGHRFSARTAILLVKASRLHFVLSRAMLDNDADWDRVRQLLEEHLPT